MVAAISEDYTPNHKPSSEQETNQNPRRPPLLPSEKDNGVQSIRRPKTREVSSRYMSPSHSSSNLSSSSSLLLSSRRCQSPINSRVSANSMPVRSQSVDRRRPGTPKLVTGNGEVKLGNSGEASADMKLLVTSSRSLSVSFQGEAFSLPISKSKVVTTTNSNGVRKGGTPEKRRSTKVDGGGGDHVENSRPGDQHRWPGRTREGNPLSMSLECDKKSNGSRLVGWGLPKSIIDESRRVSFDGRLKPRSGNSPISTSPCEFALPYDLTTSDTDSVSSGSTSGSTRLSRSRGTIVSARFWQETNSRLRRLQDPGQPLSMSPGSRIASPMKITQSKKFNDSPLASPRTMASPIRGPARPPSPSKVLTPTMVTPLRGSSSPSRARNSVSGSIDSPSILSFGVDVRRGKMGESRIFDAHLLRLLYNRHLQLRFINARAETALFMQRLSAEKNLWNAWIKISQLRDSVTIKRIKLQLLSKKMKLNSILKGQMGYLEEWALLDRDHSTSLLGAIDALKANTLRLPVVGGATADIQSVKDAFGSAFNIMHSMESSIPSLLSKVEEVNSLVAELANVTAMERALLEQSKDVLSALAALQVKECSMRTHILQQTTVPTTTLTTRV